MNRLFISRFLLPLSLLTSLASHADTYQSQLDIDGFHSDADGRVQTKIVGLTGTYYFSSVDDSEVPLNEAAFLNKASSLSLAATDNELEIDGDTGYGDGAGGALNLVLGDKYIFNVSYATADIDDVDADAYGLGAGLYINETTSIGLSYTRVDLDDVNEEFDTFAFNLHNVTDLDGISSIAGQINLAIAEEPGSQTVIQLDGAMDYYFTHKYSLGGGLAFSLPNNGDREFIYSIQSKYFITNKIALAASYSLTTFLEENETQIGQGGSQRNIDNTDTFTLSITGRL